MGKQPGVMLYFDLRDSLADLTYEDKGRLLDAILDYGKYGVVPEFSGMLKMAWNFVRPRVDQDRDRYENKVQRCRDAVNRRWDHERQSKNHTDVYERIPNTNTNTTTNTSTNTNTTTNTPNGPQKKGHWAPVVPIEDEIAALNRLAAQQMAGR